MIDLKLFPRATKIEGGRWRPEVLITHESGDQNVFRGGVVATHALALEAAERLVAAGTVEEVPIFEVPLPWR
jgi:hypothetical protein